MGESANIFVNYRREDSSGDTGRLCDHLNRRLPGRVFRDLDNLAPGVDFGEAIEQALGSCEVLIAVIGRDWLSVKDGTGHRRLDDPADYVRMELATALARKNTRVIPVLVQDASMPRKEDLPPDLAKLSRRNAIQLSDARWNYDVDRLIQTIEGRPRRRVPDPPAPPARRRDFGRSVRIGMTVIVGILAPLLVATLLPFQGREFIIAISALLMGLLTAACELYGAEGISPSDVKRRFRYALAAVLVGLLLFVLVRVVFTRNVPVGTGRVNVLIGPFPRVKGCPYPSTWGEELVISRDFRAEAIEECWGAWTIKGGLLLLWAAYLLLTGGIGSFIGAIGLQRNAGRGVTTGAAPEGAPLQ